ncbi:NADH-quinone oxidoreductase subunit N [Desulfitobacterium sp.]|uniref:NADH-quinone oxidoreductase subunit N n=1 Tax=Desulfitobacterium sp. TaxID=49981 RepID=UPI002C7F671F|nr:NADH-quinone oxidoreductase subunit N [Desulfitobacterium sp.]HVJ50022.1 NADH-quinone oxidoreductase subunit N [Desulfitobacterium sp.]
MANFNFALLTPEIVMAVLSLGLLVIGLLIPPGERKGMFPLTVFALLGTLAYTFYDFFYGERAAFLQGMYMHDQFAGYFKILFLIAALLVVLSSKGYVEKLPANRGEFYPLIMAATLGMMLMAGAGDLITMYVGLELMTITFFILVAYRTNDGKASEAGIKYLVLASASSAILLYGISIIYGLTGSTQMFMIAQALGSDTSPATILATVFLLAGIGFKISLIPFHLWAPDIYEGAPTPVTAFLAVASKAAGFAVLIRFYLLMMYSQTFVQTGQTLLLVLAAITMIVGNLVAIPQTNIKRMLAYSSIAQAGYILIGVIAVSVPAVSTFVGGIKAVLFYAMIYVFANMGAFTVATHVAQAQGSDEIKDFAGLAKRSPLAAVVMTASVLSLAGIPPLAGFVGKFYLFSAVMDQGYVWIAYVGFVMSMISVYYYLGVVKVMYSTEGEGLPDIPVHGATKFTLVFTLITTLVLGIYPTPLVQMAISAASSLVK